MILLIKSGIILKLKSMNGKIRYLQIFFLEKDETAQGKGIISEDYTEFPTFTMTVGLYYRLK